MSLPTVRLVLALVIFSLKKLARYVIISSCVSPNLLLPTMILEIMTWGFFSAWGWFGANYIKDQIWPEKPPIVVQEPERKDKQ